MQDSPGQGVNLTNHDVFAPRVPMLPRERCPWGWVYVIGAPEVPKVKIGFSVQPKQRLRDLSAGSPLELQIMAKWRGTMKDEKRLHLKLSAYRAHGEWFRLEGEVLDLVHAKRRPPKTKPARQQMWPDGTSRQLAELLLALDRPRTAARMQRYRQPRPECEPLERVAEMFYGRAESLGVHPSWVAA